MSAKRLKELEDKRKRTELQIQKLNVELELKQMDLRKIFEEIKFIKKRNAGVML